MLATNPTFWKSRVCVLTDMAAAIPEALTLKVIVEGKLKRRVDTHEAKKLRQQKDLHITRIISGVVSSQPQVSHTSPTLLATNW